MAVGGTVNGRRGDWDLPVACDVAGDLVEQPGQCLQRLDGLDCAVLHHLQGLKPHQKVQP